MTMTIPGGIDTATTTDRLAALGAVLGDCCSWPSATSFPELDDVTEPEPPADLAGLALLMGASDPWQSGTSFPDMG
jgi:hypothetical protein